MMSNSKIRYAHLLQKVCEIRSDFGYAVKVLRCAGAEYLLLQWKCGDGWEACGLRLDPWECGSLYPTYDLEDKAYYVCALFSNGAHIPLPLILGDYCEIGALQKIALKVVSSRRSFLDALIDCAYYDNQAR